MNDAKNLYELIRLIRPVYKALEGAVVRGLEGTDLTVTGRAVLEQIYDNGPLPVPRIADALIAPRQFVQKTVDELTQKGLVERRRNAAHRRSSMIALTPSGLELITRVLMGEHQVTSGVAAHLSPDDVAIARAVIATMIEQYSHKEIDDDPT